MGLNKHDISRWAEKLEGGGIKQTQGAYRRSNGDRCALGVGVSIYSDLDALFTRRGGHYTATRRFIKRLFGIKGNPTAAAKAQIDKFWDLMIEINDGDKYSFKQIADMLRRNFLKEPQITVTFDDKLDSKGNVSETILVREAVS